MNANSPAIFPGTPPPEKGGNFNAFPSKSPAQSRWLGLATAMVLCGCHKQKEAVAPTPEPVAVPSTAPAPAAPTTHGPVAQPLPPSSQAIAASANADEVAGQLSMELRRYIAYTRNIPKTFEDFAAHDPIKFPPPPAGKKYVISGGKVVIE